MKPMLFISGLMVLLLVSSTVLGDIADFDNSIIEVEYGPSATASITFEVFEEATLIITLEEELGIDYELTLLKGTEDVHNATFSDMTTTLVVPGHYLALLSANITNEMIMPVSFLFSDGANISTEVVTILYLEPVIEEVNDPFRLFKENPLFIAICMLVTVVIIWLMYLPGRYNMRTLLSKEKQQIIHIQNPGTPPTQNPPRQQSGGGDDKGGFF